MVLRNWQPRGGVLVRKSAHRGGMLVKTDTGRRHPILRRRPTTRANPSPTIDGARRQIGGRTSRPTPATAVIAAPGSHASGRFASHPTVPRSLSVPARHSGSVMTLRPGGPPVAVFQDFDPSDFDGRSAVIVSAPIECRQRTAVSSRVGPPVRAAASRRRAPRRRSARLVASARAPGATLRRWRPPARRSGCRPG